MTGVAGEYHLEQTRMTHVALDQLIDVAHAEGPVRHAHRQPVDGDLHHECVRNRLELHGVKIQPEARGKFLHAPYVTAPVATGIRLRLAHPVALASAPKKCRTAPHTPSESSMT